ncbi:hypothetical protein MKEN_01163600 [Mycena kentingensis (nom. inval.)]|nr:hypothetical protein MKEN_01163600 [Mycena kentingensis (nom. inval.)]
MLYTPLTSTTTAMDDKSNPPPLPTPATQRPAQRRSGLTVRAFLAGCVLWATLKHYSFFEWRSSPWAAAVPESVRFEDCAPWLHAETTDDRPGFPLLSHTTFSLPVDAPHLFLLARSEVRNHPDVFSAGTVRYTQTDEVADSIRVDISVEFRNRTHLAATRACMIEREDKESGEVARGVSILTKWSEQYEKRSEHTAPELRFMKEVSFPRTADGKPLKIAKFSSDLGLYAQELRGLENVHFGSLELQSTLQPVVVDTIVAQNTRIVASIAPIEIKNLIFDTAEITTSIAKIQGSFHGRALKLGSNVGAIDIVANLHARDGEVASLDIDTTTGEVKAELTLTRSTPQAGNALPFPSQLGEEGKNASAAPLYRIEAHTTRGPLTIAIHDSPVDAPILVSGSTYLGTATLSLPPTYEGQLHGRAAFSAARVLGTEDWVPDPKGLGRTRGVFVQGQFGETIVGSVWWGDGPGDPGSMGVVRMETAYSPVVIELVGGFGPQAEEMEEGEEISLL